MQDRIRYLREHAQYALHLALFAEYECNSELAEQRFEVAVQCEIEAQKLQDKFHEQIDVYDKQCFN